jgi:hypothetical protein
MFSPQRPLGFVTLTDRLIVGPRGHPTTGAGGSMEEQHRPPLRRRIVHPHVLVLGFGFGGSRKISAQSVSRQQLCQLDAVGADF